MNWLEVKNISRKEEENFIIKNISFTQQPFEKIALAGATGSGKTTLLKIIAGLIAPNQGKVLLEGIPVKAPHEKLIAGHPQIAYLSQQFELLNHYRVEEILEMKNLLSGARAQLIYEVCKIDHLLQRWTHQLSGGEKQRIALAKLLIGSPTLLLLDEPYSNLDAIHKIILKEVICNISSELKITCILVSHDPADVLSWANTVLVLKEGEIIQMGTPMQVYKQPVNEYAAALFGKYNLMETFLFQKLSPASGVKLNGRNFIRPEFLSISHNNLASSSGKVTAINFMGSYFEIVIDINGTAIIVYTQNLTVQKGERVSIALNQSLETVS